MLDRGATIAYTFLAGVGLLCIATGALLAWLAC